MKIIAFDVVWPGGNTTAIVRESVLRSRQAAVAKQIMAAHTEIEQVGFIEPTNQPDATFRLQMMGGEYCCNATRAAAFLIGKELGIEKINVEPSGLESTVTVELSETGTVIHIPKTFFIGAKTTAEYTIIDLQGIRHIIIPGEGDASRAREVIAQCTNDSLPAIGAIFTKTTAEGIWITPFVWVRETDTIIPETACGSGSIAAAIAHTEKNSPHTKTQVYQPSAEAFSVSITEDKILLAGSVACQGTATIIDDSVPTSEYLDTAITAAQRV